MSFGLSSPVLCLDRGYRPVRLTTARNAFELLFGGRAFALDEGYEPHDFESWRRVPPRDARDETIGTLRGAILVPRLVQLRTMLRVPAGRVRLSRRNIFRRDGFTCQYCGEQRGPAELNLDHVVPRARGGRSTWDNLVTSCPPCNLRKGHALPAECGMHPRTAPKRPPFSMTLQFALGPRFAAWEPFLGPHRDA